MSAAPTPQPGRTGTAPWHTLCRLREDVRVGAVSLDEFAADLNAVRRGEGPLVYRDPAAFFARTYATYNLKVLVRGVLRRLAGETVDALPVQWLELAYGGGKTHTLITLLHLAEKARDLPGDRTVKEFVDFAGVPSAPSARVAILPGDKFDPHHGLEVTGPDGRSRRTHTLWGALAYQLAGDAGFLRLAQHEESWTSPAQGELEDLLRLAIARDRSVLVLADEIIWYGREAAQVDARRGGVLKDFFQVLIQAVAAVDRSALVATLVSSRIEAYDSQGMNILQALEGVFHRSARSAEPVSRDDVAEILRRRLFESLPDESLRRAATDAFFSRLQTLPVRDEQKGQSAYDRMLRAYPFHADLVDVLYEKWSQLPQDRFQRARGALRLMALALREAEGRDPSPWVGPSSLLDDDGGVSPALRELVAVTVEGAGGWIGPLSGELGRASAIGRLYPSLPQRELEQAVAAVFLHSQPAGQSAASSDLWALLCHPGVDRAALEEALSQWRRQAWHLADDSRTWQLITAQNLTAMHLEYMNRLSASDVDAEMQRLISGSHALAHADPGVEVHVLPKGPVDVKDTPRLHYLVLGGELAAAPGREVPPEILAYWQGTAPGHPRTYKNALVAVAPDPSRLAAMRQQVARVKAWDALLRGDDLKRAGSAEQRKEAERRLQEERSQLPDTAVGCYVTALALDEGGALSARALPSGTGPTFERLKALLAAEDRLITTDLDPSVLLPGSDLGLWGEGEDAKPVGALVEAFYQFARLPRLLTPEVLRQTIRTGVAAGAFALVLARPDASAEVFWRCPVSDTVLERPEATVVLLGAARLGELDAGLLLPGLLPELWPSDGRLAVESVRAYFDGVWAPRLIGPEVLEQALGRALSERRLAVEIDGRRWMAPELPGSPLPSEAVLVVAPVALPMDELLPGAVPDAWEEDGTALLSHIADELARRRDPVDAASLLHAAQAALTAGTLVLEAGSPPPPWQVEDLGEVRLGLPGLDHVAPEALVGDAARKAWRDGQATVRELASAVAGRDRRVSSEVVTRAVREAVAQGLLRVADGSAGAVSADEVTMESVLERVGGGAAVDGQLSARELQTLARIWPELQRAAPNLEITCSCSVLVKGDVPPEVRERLRALLGGVRPDWRDL